MLPGYVEFTDEEERMLDQIWAETYDQLHGAPFDDGDEADESEEGESIDERTDERNVEHEQ